MITRAEVEGGQQLRKPRMRLKGVSVAIVLGVRESRVQGEGPHRERRVRSNPVRCQGVGIRAKADGALRPVSPLMGSPYAVKAARTVATGGMERRAIRYRALSLPTPYNQELGPAIVTMTPEPS
jgi:hypothetical protein